MKRILAAMAMSASLAIGCGASEVTMGEGQTEEVQQAIVQVLRIRRMTASEPGLIENNELWPYEPAPTAMHYFLPLSAVFGPFPEADLYWYYDPGDPSANPPVPARCQPDPF